MKIVLMVIGSLVALVVLFVIWRVIATVVGHRRAYARLAARIAPVTEPLAAGRDPDPAHLAAFAADRETRQVLHDALVAHDRVELFPREYLTWEAMAEANLVKWLHHPNELGSPPDEIEMMARVPAPGMPGWEYFVFRYRVHPPHWAAKDGWMAGVAGPYDLAQPPAPHGDGTFSRFEPFDSRTPEEHVAVTHGLLLPGQR